MDLILSYPILFEYANEYANECANEYAKTSHSSNMQQDNMLNRVQGFLS